jgi:hypothetical protein
MVRESIVHSLARITLICTLTLGSLSAMAEPPRLRRRQKPQARRQRSAYSREGTPLLRIRTRRKPFKSGSLTSTKCRYTLIPWLSEKIVCGDVGK